MNIVPTTQARALATAAIVILSPFTAAAENRSIDGSGNNVDLPHLGASGTRFARLAPSAYDDGLATPAVGERKNPRVISNNLCDSTQDKPNHYRLSDYVWQWGQFLDHDITLSLTGGEPFSIEVGPGDPMEGIIPMSRTIFDPETGINTPREQNNSVTSFIDGSMIYGADSVRAAALRSYDGGRLKTSDAGLMPMNTDGLPNANALNLPEHELFLGGDVRSNEQLGLTCMHTIFVREHNRLADTIATENPGWGDQAIYERARKIIGAYVQSITYNEFLPAMLGPMAPDPSTFSYDPSRDPSITNEFATAIYRIGHTMVSDQLLMMQDDGQPAPGHSIGVFDAFFTPSTLINNPEKVDWILMGLSKQIQQQVDTKIVGSLRNQLFGPAGAGGLDLAAINIQRGRDHGLASYNDTRLAYGLPPKSSLDEITSDPEMRQILGDSYSHPDEIDLWIGALMEDHLPGVPVGELMATSLRSQFTDLAEGDRFFYLYDPELSDIANEIDATTLSDIIMRNSGLSTMHADIFHSAPEFASSRLMITMAGNDAQLEMAGAEPTANYRLARSFDGLTWEVIATELQVSDDRIITTDPGIGASRSRAFYKIEKVN